MTRSTSLRTSSDPVRALLYARSAFEHHPGPDSAVERQLSELRTFVDSHGWSNQGEYSDEGISGLTRNRPALGRLFRACRAGQANVVVVTDTARLARNVVLFLALVEKLKAMDVQVVVTDGPLVTDGHHVPAVSVPLIALLERFTNE